MVSFLRGVREYLTPVLQASAFLDRGVLTPDEFVAAGDQLVRKCPTWAWMAAEEGRTRPHLPHDKQYLVTRGVPSFRRVRQLENLQVKQGLVADGSTPDGDEWFITEVLNSLANDDLEVIHPDDEVVVGEVKVTSPAVRTSRGLSAAMVDESYIPPSQTNSDEYADFGADVETDEATVPPGQQPAQTQDYFQATEPDDDDDVIVQTRRYDLSITYDKYYQTPRIFLFGYDEMGQPLSGPQVFEDIITDYAHRTVTMESHPHVNSPHASIHPCQHGAVMRRIVSNISRGGRVPKVDQYLFIFLKFVQSVIPTIEYDYTMDVAMELNSSQPQNEHKS